MTDLLEKVKTLSKKSFVLVFTFPEVNHQNKSGKGSKLPEPVTLGQDGSKVDSDVLMRESVFEQQSAEQGAVSVDSPTQSLPPKMGAEQARARIFLAHGQDGSQ